MGFTKGKGRFAMVIGRTAPRVELYFGNDPDKRNFDAMKEFQSELDEAFGGRLEWQRLEAKKASRIKYEMVDSEIQQMGEWRSGESRSFRVDWYVRELQKFFETVYPFLEKAQSHLGKRLQ